MGDIVNFRERRLALGSSQCEAEPASSVAAYPPFSGRDGEHVEDADLSYRLYPALWALDLPPAEKLVALALTDHERDGVCWPGAETVAAETGLTERGVRGILKRLERKGVIRIERRKGKSHRYWLTPELASAPIVEHRKRDALTPEPRSATPARRSDESLRIPQESKEAFQKAKMPESLRKRLGSLRGAR